MAQKCHKTIIFAYCKRKEETTGMTEMEFQHEVARLLPQLRKLATGYMGSSDEADDVVQDVLVGLWQIRGELRIPMDSLVRVMLRNSCVSALRRRKPTVRVGEISTPEEESNDHLVDLMMYLIGQLPPMQQLVVHLRHLSGMGMEEIAATVGKSEEAVRQLLSRGRRQLRQLMMEKMKE